jgi:hypothetical protein
VRGSLTLSENQTLAVPQALYDKGLHDFADIVKFKKELDGKIYGIEPGNDGNRLVLEMIEENQHGLRGFKLVESSEQGMLAEIERAVPAKRPIVFLAWAPHPMNTRFTSATDGRRCTSAQFGARPSHSRARAGQCPGVGRLLRTSVRRRHRERSWPHPDARSRPIRQRNGGAARPSSAGWSGCSFDGSHPRAQRADGQARAAGSRLGDRHKTRSGPRSSVDQKHARAVFDGAGVAAQARRDRNARGLPGGAVAVAGFALVAPVVGRPVHVRPCCSS